MSVGIRSHILVFYVLGDSESVEKFQKRLVRVPNYKHFHRMQVYECGDPFPGQSHSQAQ